MAAGGMGRGSKRLTSRDLCPSSTARRSTAGKETTRRFAWQEEAIVGGSLKAPVPRNEFLCLKQEYRDFELRLQFKLLGEGTNAGVQIRSRRIPNHHEMIGYQADLGDGWWGCLYDESRRNKVLAGPPDDATRQDRQTRRLERIPDSLHRSQDRAVDQRPEDRRLHRTRREDRTGRTDRPADPRRPAERSVVQEHPHQGARLAERATGTGKVPTSPCLPHRADPRRARHAGKRV